LLSTLSTFTVLAAALSACTLDATLGSRMLASFLACLSCLTHPFGIRTRFAGARGHPQTHRQGRGSREPPESRFPHVWTLLLIRGQVPTRVEFHSSKRDNTLPVSLSFEGEKSYSVGDRKNTWIRQTAWVCRHR